MSYWDEISVTLASLGSATAPEAKAALNEFDVRDIQAVRVVEGGGGGSSPTGVSVRRLVFTETNGAGTYTASLVLPSGSHFLDYTLFLVSLWTADDVAFSMGDTQQGGAAIINDISLEEASGYIPYDPTNTIEGTDFDTYAHIGGGQVYQKQAGWLVADTNDGHAPGIYYPSGTTITAVVSTEAASEFGATGVLHVLVYYMTPASTAAVKVDA